MRIFLICSKSFYSRIPELQKELEAADHVVTLPNSYEDPAAEERHRGNGPEKHAAWKAEMIKHSTKVISNTDAVLVLNFEKKGIQNYIGGATFLEMYDAFRLGKKIYLFNDPPEGVLQDEILGFNPILIRGDLSKIV
jgi:hypothetical protein